MTQRYTLMRIFFRFSSSLLVLVFSCIFFFRCASEKKIEDHTVFRYNELRNITSLDPAFARNPQNIWPIQQLFNGLVQLDNQLNVIPEIAHSWDIDPTGKTYTFYLRDSVFFHQSDFFGAAKTRTVEAEDFTYSFDRLLDPKVGSPGGWVLQQVKAYRAVDKNTFQIELKKPFPAFLGLLTMRYCTVVPKEVISAAGDQFRKHPIGTGPFKFQAWEENVKLVLRKNKTYFEKNKKGEQLPHLEAIAIQFLNDRQSEFLQFKQGKFDFINSLDAAYKDELLTPDGKLNPEYKVSVQFQKGPYLNTEYLGLYLDKKNTPLNDIRIRQAINIGFDREKMITYLRNTIGIAALKGIIPNGLGGQPHSDLIRYQPKYARELVDAYKKDNNTVSPKITLATDANYLDVCEFLQQELAKIGLAIEINLMPTATLRQMKTKGKLEAFRASWIADYPDAENYLSLFYAKNHSPNGPNYTHYENVQFDSLYQKTMDESRPKERLKQYRKMDALMMKDYPIVPLYYDEIVRFVHKNVVGLEMNPLNLLYLKNVKKKKVN